MRRSSSTRTCGLLLRILASIAIMVVLLPLAWLLIAIKALWFAPVIMRDAWQDWSFHKRRYPKSGYTLWRAVKLQARIWVAES